MFKQGEQLATQLYKKTPQKVKTVAFYSSGIIGLLILVPIVILIGIVSVATFMLWLPPMVIGLYLVNKVLEKYYPKYSLKKIFDKYHMKMWNKLLFDGGSLQLWFWERAYNFMFKGQTNGDIVALNYGYALLSDTGKYLDKYSGDKFVYQYQLYDFLINMVGGIKNMKGKVLIEVGCGRGGCFRFVTTEYKPQKAIGYDLSQENINFCL